jgi:hypothetical protein
MAFEIRMALRILLEWQEVKKVLQTRQQACAQSVANHEKQL